MARHCRLPPIGENKGLSTVWDAFLMKASLFCFKKFSCCLISRRNTLCNFTKISSPCLKRRQNYRNYSRNSYVSQYTQMPKKRTIMLNILYNTKSPRLFLLPFHGEKGAAANKADCCIVLRKEAAKAMISKCCAGFGTTVPFVMRICSHISWLLNERNGG